MKTQVKTARDINQVRVPLRASKVEELQTPRGFEFRVNRKNIILQLNKVNVDEGKVAGDLKKANLFE